MELKKNPKADLRKRSVLFLQLGLILALGVSYFAIEKKTYEKGDGKYDLASVDDDDEEIPIVELNTPPPPPPPPPPPAPEIIEVVEDEEEIEETIIESTETTQDEEIVEVEEVEVVEEEEEIADVPFAVIENVPIFPGCESKKNNADRKACMSSKVSKLVNKKFNTELGADLGLSGVNRIFVSFKIDKNGNITNIRSRAPHPRLEQEAERVIKLLPKMTPGKQRGQPVGVLYSLPITFKVED